MPAAQDITVALLDDQHHLVTEKLPITVTKHLSPLVDMVVVDSETLESKTVKGRIDVAVTHVPGTRFVCKCGFSIDQADEDLDSEENQVRFGGSAGADCAQCVA